ncbi:MAG: alpha/beta hydrolase [Planctomycetes bacterium]|nr:alpha/beta hydrolase [Planctomycetota bacterium]
MSEFVPGAVTAPANSPAATDAVPLPSSGGLVPDGVPVNAEGVPSGEACPPPLVWQEVLAAYRTESNPWELDRGTRRLFGRTWGAGPPLYLLNGFAATAELYALLVYLLRDSFQCVVFDTFSNSSSGRARPNVGDFAQDLLAVADHHDDPSILVFAANFGAAVAMQSALDRPDRIVGLALEHGFARRRLSLSERLLAQWCRGSSRSLSTLPWRSRIQELNHRRWFPPFDGTRFEFLKESTGQIPLKDLAQKALAMNAVDLRPRLSEIRCPVMLMRTEGQGPLETEGHEVLEKGLPNARTEWLHSTGLHPYLTHPHRVAKLLKAYFLADPSKPQS